MYPSRAARVGVRRALLSLRSLVTRDDARSGASTIRAIRASSTVAPRAFALARAAAIPRLARPPAAAHRAHPAPRSRAPARDVSSSAAAEASNAPTTVAFADLDLCPQSLRALAEVKGFQHATAVQDATLPPIIRGVDVLARAKTGSGKTIAFLLPALEKLVRDRDRDGDTVSVLVLSPTRELATQIHEEATQLLTFHERVGAQVVYGGTNIRGEVSRLRSNRCDILVATPGRLLDHLENENLARRLAGCHTLVLDEADRLLDMGFQAAIEKILKYVPPERQTLLFSATVSDGIRAIALASLRPGHVYVDCVGEEDSSATNLQVRQSAATVPLEDQFAELKRVVDEHAANTPNHKIMCFFTTARATALAAELFGQFRDDVVEIHSKLSQSRRTKATERFREMPAAVMMTSDVTARGIDFPDVTLVIQVGVPANRETYIHRLGRTGRAGKSGEGVLLLSERESFFAKDVVGDLPIERLPPRDVDPAAAETMRAAMARVKEQTKAQHYSAWLGFYKPFMKKMGLTPEGLVREANSVATDVLGLDEPPGMLKKTVGMIGLKGVPGLNIVKELPKYDDEAPKGSPSTGGGKRRGAAPRDDGWGSDRRAERARPELVGGRGTGGRGRGRGGGRVGGRGGRGGAMREREREMERDFGGFGGGGGGGGGGGRGRGYSTRAGGGGETRAEPRGRSPVVRRVRRTRREEEPARERSRERYGR